MQVRIIMDTIEIELPNITNVFVHGGAPLIDMGLKPNWWKLKGIPINLVEMRIYVDPQTTDIQFEFGQYYVDLTVVSR